jgi:hypothetical protein
MMVDEKAVVVDTKYYREGVLAGGRYSSKGRPGHLYQLSTYPNHVGAVSLRSNSSACSYILRLGTLSELNYELLGTLLTVATVDLSAEWPAIHGELLNIFCSLARDVDRGVLGRGYCNPTGGYLKPLSPNRPENAVIQLSTI